MILPPMILRFLEHRTNLQNHEGQNHKNKAHYIFRTEGVLNFLVRQAAKILQFSVDGKVLVNETDEPKGKKRERKEKKAVPGYRTPKEITIRPRPA